MGDVVEFKRTKSNKNSGRYTSLTMANKKEVCQAIKDQLKAKIEEIKGKNNDNNYCNGFVCNSGRG